MRALRDKPDHPAGMAAGDGDAAGGVEVGDVEVGGVEVGGVAVGKGAGGAAGPAIPAQPGPDCGGTRRSRIVPRRPGERMRVLGRDTLRWGDFYHRTLLLRWRSFLSGVAVLYLGVNACFALLFMADPAGVTELRPGSFADAFFFSVQTLSTVGYGRLTPVSAYANLVVTAEALVGLGIFALVTGLGFARFSRPTAKVAFSRIAVINSVDGVPTLAIRMANSRRNQILQASVTLTLLQMERTAEGESFRRFYDLKLRRSHTPVFGLSFTLQHTLDESSLLHPWDEAALQAKGAEILVTVTGLDDTLSQTIHARHSYSPDEVVAGRRFADMFVAGPDGQLSLDLGRLHELR